MNTTEKNNELRYQLEVTTTTLARNVSAMRNHPYRIQTQQGRWYCAERVHGRDCWFLRDGGKKYKLETAEGNVEIFLDFLADYPEICQLVEEISQEENDRIQAALDTVARRSACEYAYGIVSPGSRYVPDGPEEFWELPASDPDPIALEMRNIISKPW